MKKLVCGTLAATCLLFSACNNGSNKNEKAAAEIKKDSMPLVASTDEKDAKIITITYPDINTKTAASVKEIVDHYLQIKNALANDNGNDAAGGGKAMEKSIRQMDTSLLTAEQKKKYGDIEDGMREDAEHIGKNGSNIKHQREHFSMMSQDVYELVKAFGGGRLLYHDHCPMYNEGKGALWLSEIKEIKNPYLGAEMPDCGSVEEIVK